MSVVNIPISNLLNTVERPLIYAIVKQLCDLTGISSKTQIRFYGDEAKAMQWNSGIDKSKEFHNQWPLMENLTIEVVEEDNKDRMLSIAVEKPEVPYIFNDPALGIYIKPVRSPTNVVINFKYKATDENQVKRWRNQIRTRYAKNREINMHEATYSYQFPNQFVSLLYEIWKLRNNIASYNDTFEDYFYKHADDKLTRVANLSGKNVMLTIADREKGIQGVYDFEGMPEKPEKEDIGAMWTIGFSYSFQYDKPVDLVCKYPIAIHQQLLPVQFRHNPVEYKLENQWTQTTISGMDYKIFTGQDQIDRMWGNKGLNIPRFDYFIPGSVTTSTLRVFSALVCITPNDRRTLLNLKHLGEFSMHPDILTFIAESEYKYVTNLFQSIIQINLYSNEDIMDPGILTVDSNLNVVATSDLDLRKTYHLRLSLVANLLLLNTDAIKRLKLFTPSVLEVLVTAINAGLSQSGNSTGLFKNSLNQADLNLLGIPNKQYNTNGATLVATLFINSFKEGQETNTNTIDPTVINTNSVLPLNIAK